MTITSLSRFRTAKMGETRTDHCDLSVQTRAGGTLLVAVGVMGSWTVRTGVMRWIVIGK